MTVHPRWMYLVVSAAPPARHIGELVTLLQAHNWQVCVIATPAATDWINLDDLATATGCLTRTDARSPDEQDSLPHADLVVVAPLTFNTLNKWANGINDTLALGILNELLGIDIPIIAAPCIKAALRRHPAYSANIERLSKAGVAVLDPDAITGRDDRGLAIFDWDQVIGAISSKPGSEVPRGGA